MNKLILRIIKKMLKFRIDVLEEIGAGGEHPAVDMIDCEVELVINVINIGNELF